MWTLKIKIPYERGMFFSNISKRFNVSIVGYPISNQIKENYVLVTITGFVQGTAKDISSMIKYAKKDKRVIKIETKNNFVIMEVKQHIINKFLFTPGIFHIKPVIVTRKGEYIFEIGAWEKKPLSEIIKIYKEHVNAEIEYFKEKIITNVQTINIYPNLTDKQKKCLDLAIKNNYYDYPRRITLKELAKIAKISYSTYQFHLQNAEKKMMPFLNSLI